MDKVKKVINSPLFQAAVTGGIGVLLLLQGHLLYAGIGFGVGLVKFINAFKSDQKPIINNIMKSKGLGDTLEKIAKATGIQYTTKLVEKVTKKPCGCGKRKEALNKVFPYKNT